MLNCSLTQFSFAAVGTFALLTGAAVPSQAQSIPSNSSHTVNIETAKAISAEQYWTSARLLSAKLMEPAPQVRWDGLPLAAGPTGAAKTEPAVKSSGALPSIKDNGALSRQLIPEDQIQQLERETFESVVPEATSSFGAHFTTSRVFPDAATTSYPYSTAGKLFFSDPKTGGNFVCSASVLRPRIIVTAGHCVTHPSTTEGSRYFYSNFFFVPAYNNGGAPFGTWTPSTEWVSNAWYFSDGSVPNDQDVAMLVARDQSSTKLGYRTGWLGYFTNQLGNDHLTMLGYPCNLDSCGKMEETFAQTFEYGGNNTYIYGSAMRGGASGGPWIQDFGIAPAGAPAGLLGNNYLVAVTSYGPISTTPQYLGASNLDSRFISLLTDACGATSTGNCN